MEKFLENAILQLRSWTHTYAQFLTTNIDDFKLESGTVSNIGADTSRIDEAYGNDIGVQYDERPCEEYSNLIQFDPEQASRLQESGFKKFNDSDYTGALADFEKANRFEPNCASTLKYLGEIKRYLCDYDGALEDFNHADSVKPNDTFILSRLGTVKKERGEYEEALKDLDRAHELNPNNIFIYAQRGVVRQSLMKFNEAMEDLHEAYNLDPTSAFVLAHRGTVERELGHYEEALEDLNKASTLEPNYVYALQQRGVVKRLLDDLDGALADLNRALEIKPNDAYTLRRRGVTKRELLNFEGALQDLDLANEVEPFNNLTLSERGVTKKALEDFHGALDDLILATCIEPDHVFTLIQQALVRRELRDYEGSLENLNAALKLKPNDFHILFERGLTRMKRKDYDGALEDYNKAKDLEHEGSACIFQEMGALKRILKDYQGALEDLNMADLLQPDNAIILKERSFVKHALGDASGAYSDAKKAYALGGFMQKSYYKGALHEEAIIDVTLSKEPFEHKSSSFQKVTAFKEFSSDSYHTLLIDHKELLFIKKLGEGSFGVVHKCFWQGKEVAVKYFGGPQKLDALIYEVGILASLQHPRIVRLIGCTFDNKERQGVLVMELMSTNLRSLIDNQKRESGSPFSLTVTVDIMTQVAEGMMYLHEKKVLHRDLKSNNILLHSRGLLFNGEEHFNVKIADFGLAKYWKHHNMTQCTRADMGATLWRAPEVLTDAKSGGYSWPADVWSYAITCSEILTGKEPFEGIPHSSIRASILDGVRPDLSQIPCPKVISSLLQKCWSLKQFDRPTFIEIFNVLRLYRSLLSDIYCESRPGDAVKVEQLSQLATAMI